MNYCKMNGTGNDFIIINNIEEGIPHEDLGKLAKHLCTRRLSIGADGLMAVSRPTTAGCDYRMLFFNADGSESEMCGNGVRCIARYGYENGLTGGCSVMRIETAAGAVACQRLSERMYRVEMNRPQALRIGVRITPPKVMESETSVSSTMDPEAEKHKLMPIVCDYIELGNPGIPHAVIHCPGLYANEKEAAENTTGFDCKNLKDIAKTVRWSEQFYKGANVTFYDFVQCTEDKEVPDYIYIKTYERGVEDFTYACGTGSAALAIILKQRGIVKSDSVTVVQKGGKLTVEFEAEKIYLKGPANTVAFGTVADEQIDILYHK